jgi:hypothetical protein
MENGEIETSSLWIIMFIVQNVVVKMSSCMMMENVSVRGVASFGEKRIRTIIWKHEEDFWNIGSVVALVSMWKQGQAEVFAYVGRNSK